MDDLDNDLKKEILDLLNKDEKVKAIKKLREKTGMGLKEAKEFIDKV